MRNVFLVLTIIVFTGTMCPPPPYRTKNIYAENKKDSDRIDFHNGLRLVFKYSGLDWNSHSVGVAVFCDLQNPTNYVQVLKRKKFSAASSRGIIFKESSMVTADESGLWFKLYTLPDLYPVAPQQNTDYVFIFQSVDKYTKEEALNHLKSDTIFFILNGDGVTDTLIKIVGIDRKFDKR